MEPGWDSINVDVKVLALGFSLDLVGIDLVLLVGRVADDEDDEVLVIGLVLVRLDLRLMLD